MKLKKYRQKVKGKDFLKVDLSTNEYDTRTTESVSVSHDLARFKNLN